MFGISSRFVFLFTVILPFCFLGPSAVAVDDDDKHPTDLSKLSTEELQEWLAYLAIEISEAETAHEEDQFGDADTEAAALLVSVAGTASVIIAAAPGGGMGSAPS